jgi:hypothetical protein
VSGYALHPEAFIDLDGIREHRAEDSPDAADRVKGKSSAEFAAWWRFPIRLSTSKSHFAPATVQTGAEIRDRLRAGEKTVVGCGRISRAAQPPRDGRDSKRPGVAPITKPELAEVIGLLIS